ncbi:hypothetical protein GTA08_BOTSDO08819 [Botryosphaeria dothidea]|uniref:Uncharacterized protein n=1 Tax=Botryosphaeria dothidea TaxID=55169 RepID=A0A8H4IKU8_9PEZI|nr:hypothetical protein GTA08_BOTSDO08819 [Botryosphaeria dothidea]
MSLFAQTPGPKAPADAPAAINPPAETRLPLRDLDLPLSAEAQRPPSIYRLKNGVSGASTSTKPCLDLPLWVRNVDIAAS